LDTIALINASLSDTVADPDDEPPPLELCDDFSSGGKTSTFKELD
jgi:hypothetical protein